MRSRWTIAAAGAALMACLGTVYAWSLFAQPLAVAFGWSSTVTTWAFASNILALGLGALAGGRWQDRAGPRRVALAGVLLWAAGNVLAGLLTARLGAAWLYATYGLAGGFGIGLAYVTPVAAVARWFPERRGLGTGVVVMGFGLGAFFHAHALRALPAFAAAAREAAALAAAGEGARLSAGSTSAVLGAFVGSGVVFAVVGGLAAAMLRNPPTPTATPTAPPMTTSSATPAGSSTDLPLSAALRTRRFWILFALLFLKKGTKPVRMGAVTQLGGSSTFRARMKWKTAAQLLWQSSSAPMIPPFSTPSNAIWCGPGRNSANEVLHGKRRLQGTRSDRPNVLTASDLWV
jgi:MFS family permease